MGILHTYVAGTVVILLSSEFLPARGFVSVRDKQWRRSSRILALPPSLLPPCVNSAKCGGSQSWETMTTLDTMPCSRNTQWHYDPATHPRRLMLFLNWWPSTVCIDFFIVIGADYEVRRRRYCVQFVMTFDLLTSKVLSESRVTWATSVPIFVFLGLFVLDLSPMYATDVRQTGLRCQTASSLNAPCPIGGGA